MSAMSAPVSETEYVAKINDTSHVVDEHCFSSNDQPYRSRVFDIEKRLDVVLKLSQVKDVHNRLCKLENRRQLMRTTSAPNLKQRTQDQTHRNTNEQPSGTKCVLDRACFEFFPRLLEQQEFLTLAIVQLQKEVQTLKSQIGHKSIAAIAAPGVSQVNNASTTAATTLSTKLVPTPPSAPKLQASTYTATTAFARILSVDRLREINQKIRRKQAIPFEKSIYPL